VGSLEIGGNLLYVQDSAIDLARLHDELKAWKPSLDETPPAIAYRCGDPGALLALAGGLRSTGNPQELVHLRVNAGPSRAVPPVDWGLIVSRDQTGSIRTGTTPNLRNALRAVRGRRSELAGQELGIEMYWWPPGDGIISFNHLLRLQEVIERDRPRS
jgi:hypothetical protein